MTIPEKKIRKILAAIDFSTYSKNTLEYAYEVSQTTGADLIMVNIINQRDIDAKKEMVNAKHPDDFSLATYLPEEMGLRKLKLKALITRCGFKNRPAIKMVIDYGTPVDKILQVLEEEEADLLVMGPKGRTNLRSFLFGSVAEKLFRHSPVPVMSLRSRPE